MVSVRRNPKKDSQSRRTHDVTLVFLRFSLTCLTDSLSFRQPQPFISFDLAGNLSQSQENRRIFTREFIKRSGISVNLLQKLRAAHPETNMPPVPSCFIGLFFKDHFGRRVHTNRSAHRYRPGELSLVFSCLEISDRAKYAGWNDLDDLDDLHDFDAQLESQGQ